MVGVRRDREFLYLTFYSIYPPSCCDNGDFGGGRGSKKITFLFSGGFCFVLFFGLKFFVGNK